MSVRCTCLINLNFGSLMSFKVFTRPGSNNCMYLYNFRKSENIRLIPKGHREELHRTGAPVLGRLPETDRRFTEGHR